jgi:hypothetical protein
MAYLHGFSPGWEKLVEDSCLQAVELPLHSDQVLLLHVPHELRIRT